MSRRRGDLVEESDPMALPSPVTFCCSGLRVRPRESNFTVSLLTPPVLQLLVFFLVSPLLLLLLPLLQLDGCMWQVHEWALYTRCGDKHLLGCRLSEEVFCCGAQRISESPDILTLADLLPNSPDRLMTRLTYVLAWVRK